jgi:outer membrane protein assembly factor BamB
MERIREREAERILALSARDGKLIWSNEYPASYLGVDYGSGPRATPQVEAGKVYTLGTMGDLRCLDVSDGRLIWARDLKKDYNVHVPVWGMAAAPWVEGNLLIVNAGAGEQDAALVAFDRESGKEVWRALGDPPGYSAPVVFEIGGARQLIWWSPRALNSLNPKTGELYWREEFRCRHGLSLASPVLHRDILIVSAFYNGILAMRMDRHRPRAKLLYRSARRTNEMVTDYVHCLMSTPCCRGDHLYGVDSYGELRCLEVETGRRIWETLAATGKSRWSNAHLIPNGDVTFLFNEHGELIISKLTPGGYHEIDRTKLLEPTMRVSDRMIVWSHPAFADRAIFARNDREIIRVSLVASP